MEKKTGKQKLTLCDWCVLVAVISLFASLANPAVSKAVEEKKLIDMVDRLQSVRANIQLYKAQHDGLLPGQRFEGDSVTPDQFMDALTEQDEDRETSYFHQFPDNPYMSEAGQGRSLTCVNDPDATPTGTEGTAWWFNAATGQFHACDSEFHANY